MTLVFKNGDVVPDWDQFNYSLKINLKCDKGQNGLKIENTVYDDVNKQFIVNSSASEGINKIL